MPTDNPNHPDWGGLWLPRELAAIFLAAGWTDARNLHRAVWVCLLESNGYDRRVGINPDGSRDRGLWQINDRAHPDVTDEEAFDPGFATTYARKMYTGARNSFGPWAANQRIAAADPGEDEGVDRMCRYAADGVANYLRERVGRLA